MTRMVVGTFDSRRDADEARQRLLAHGFGNEQIRVEGAKPSAGLHSARHATTAPPPHQPGVLDRIFGGLVPNNDEIAQYASALHQGKSVVILRVADDEAERARSILCATGETQVTPSPEKKNAAPPKRDETGKRERAAMNVSLSYGGVDTRTNPLPNAPTNWDQAPDLPDTIEPSTDRRRPQGLVQDAQGLGSDDPSARASGSAPAHAGKSQAPEKCPNPRAEPRDYPSAVTPIVKSDDP